MSSVRPNKENIAPDSSMPTPPSSIPDNVESTFFENPDGFVEISLTSNDDKISAPPELNSSRAIKLAAEKRKRDELSDEEDKRAAEKRMRDTLSDEEDEDIAQGMRSMESSTDLNDVTLDELLEIERSIPEYDLEPPPRPHTPFANRSIRIKDRALTELTSRNQFDAQSSRLRDSARIPRSMSGLDPSALPAPLQVNKPSYFSKDEPMKTDSEHDSDSDDSDDSDDWSSDEENGDGGIRREFVQLSFEEWKLRKHPRFGKYRVKDTSGLRICETIKTVGTVAAIETIEAIETTETTESIEAIETMDTSA